MSKRLKRNPQIIPWSNVRLFLENNDIIEMLCVCREFALPFYRKQSFFTTFSVKNTDDLMTNIRRFLQHKQTICVTTFFRMDIAAEWPFETQCVRLVSCSSEPKWSDKVKNIQRFLYDWQLTHCKSKKR